MKNREITKNFKEFYAECLKTLGEDRQFVKKVYRRLFSNATKKGFEIDFSSKESVITVSKTLNGKTLFRGFYVPTLYNDFNEKPYCKAILKGLNTFVEIKLEDGRIIKKPYYTSDIKFQVIIDENNEVHFVDYKQVADLLNFPNKIIEIFNSKIDFLRDRWSKTKGVDVYFHGYKKICTEDNPPFKKGMMFSRYGDVFNLNRSPDQMIKSYVEYCWMSSGSDYLTGNLNLPLTPVLNTPVARCIKEMYGCANGCTNSCKKDQFKKTDYNLEYKLYTELKELKQKYTDEKI
jgi:hypothetical protein